MLFALCFSADGAADRENYRIGFLVSSLAIICTARMEAFQQGLRKLGYIEGKNIVIEYRYAEGKLIGSPSLRRSWCVLRSI